MFSTLTKSLKSFCTVVAHKLQGLFQTAQIDQATITAVERILLSADAGVPVTQALVQRLQQDWQAGQLPDGAALQQHLARYLTELLAQSQITLQAPIYLLVGINGSGKTSLVGKLAYRFQQAGKKVLVVAADTFRSAAVQQLEQLVAPLGLPVIAGASQSAPAAVVFQGCEAFKSGQYDILLIDTAGRLQAREDLLRELAKITRVLAKQLPQTAVSTILTVDTILGQNSLEQVRSFQQHVPLTAIALTKMDSASKGGVALAITSELQVPIAYVAFGEKLSDLAVFDPQAYITALLAE